MLYRSVGKRNSIDINKRLNNAVYNDEFNKEAVIMLKEKKIIRNGMEYIVRNSVPDIPIAERELLIKDMAFDMNSVLKRLR